MISTVAAEHLHRFASVPGQLRMDTAPLEKLHDHFRVNAVVLCYQDILAVQDAVLISGLLPSLQPDLFLCGQVIFQYDSKCSSLAFYTLAVDSALHQVHQVLADIKAKPLPVSEADLVVVFPLEGKEHLLAELLADTDPVVSDGIDMAGLAVLVGDTGDKIYRTGGLRELDRVAQEINEDPLHIFGVHHDIPILTALDLGPEEKSRLRCLLADDRIYFFDHMRLPDCRADCDSLTGVDAARLEHFIDETHQIPAGRLYFLQILPDLR